MKSSLSVREIRGSKNSKYIIRNDVDLTYFSGELQEAKEGGAGASWETTTTFIALRMVSRWRVRGGGGGGNGKGGEALRGV